MVRREGKSTMYENAHICMHKYKTKKKKLTLIWMDSCIGLNGLSVFVLPLSRHLQETQNILCPNLKDLLLRLHKYDNSRFFFFCTEIFHIKTIQVEWDISKYRRTTEGPQTFGSKIFHELSMTFQYFYDDWIRIFKNSFYRDHTHKK